MAESVVKEENEVHDIKDEIKDEPLKFSKLTDVQKKQIRIMFSTFFIVFAVLLIYFCTVLFMENFDANARWVNHLKDSPEQAAKVQELSTNANEVTVGTYVENIRNIDIKGSSYRVDMMVWFDWEGDPDLDPASQFRVYKGSINKSVIMNEIHEGGKNYQLVGVDVTISNDFHTKLYPLESHQLRIYIESNIPVQRLLFKADRENSGINKSLALTGFELSRHDIGEVSYSYASTHGNPRLEGSETTSEIVTAIEISRSNLGLYFKCFIALFATLVWILISLFICTYHHVNPLGMVSGALFGAVGNIVVGTNLLPDATTAGLLEFGNIWGAIMVLGGTIAIISINRVRELRDKKYAKYYGRFLFTLILCFTIGGMVLLPAFALIGG